MFKLLLPFTFVFALFALVESSRLAKRGTLDPLGGGNLL
nr:venom polypeptide precursor [Doratifera vulnerans]